MSHIVPNLQDPRFLALPLKRRLSVTGRYYTEVVKVRETAPYRNRGPEIDVWSRYLNYEPGQPWCGIGATTMLRFAGYDGWLPSGVGSTWAWATQSIAKGYARPKGSRLEEGDIWVTLNADGRTGHMGGGLADGFADPNTWEGNTNDDGSREGYEMALRHRELVASKRVVLIRLPGFGSDEPTPPQSVRVTAVVQKTLVPARLIEDDAQPVAILGLRAMHDGRLLTLVGVAPGFATVVFNRTSVEVRVPMYVVDGVGYAPARVIAKGMGRALVWDNALKRVTIG